MKYGRVLFEALRRVDRGGEFLKAAAFSERDPGFYCAP